MFGDNKIISIDLCEDMFWALMRTIAPKQDHSYEGSQYIFMEKSFKLSHIYHQISLLSKVAEIVMIYED